ncbi:MAG TPA: hypothetical protein ENJ37_00205 [Deltaproteobacteria bacterium]|nr:hypothetical protein [Deltaproteobacteria bacterium]
MTDTKLVYTLEFDSPVGVFTGLGVTGLLDRTVVRRSDGAPCIPGSTVKGRLRFFVERVLRASQGKYHDFTMHGEDKPLCKEADRACVVCRLFGAPAIPAMLHFSDAVMDGAVWESLKEAVGGLRHGPVFRPGSIVRPGVALSRRTRRAMEDHLYFDEVVGPAVFKGRIVCRGLKEEEIAFLKGVARLVDAVGGRKAAGRGRLRGGIVIREDEG